MQDWKISVSATLKEVVTPILLYVWVLTTVVVAIAGPFGTFEAMPIGLRFAYWSVVIAASMILAVFFRVLWRVIIKNNPAWLEDSLVIGCLAIVFGPFVEVLNVRLWPHIQDLVSWEFVSLVTFMIGMGTVALRHVVQRGAKQDTPARDRLLDRTNAGEGIRLARIYSDNHHIRVITSDGTEHRLLMRLRDAVSEIDVEPGICVHRSHWVAMARIAKMTQANGRDVVELTCGSHIPVGPKYRPNLVEMGVINA